MMVLMTPHLVRLSLYRRHSENKRESGVYLCSAWPQLTLHLSHN